MKLTAREIAVFGMLGAVMYASKILMDVFPNIHLLGVFTMAFTMQYGKKALYPIYIYVLILGLFSGFAAWWVPHLYLWTILWGVTMLLPRHMPRKVAAVVYPLVCGLHGLAFGILYAPAQALFFRLDFAGMLAWIAAGFPFDLLHAVGNLAAGCLILPLSALLLRLLRRFPS